MAMPKFKVVENGSAISTGRQVRLLKGAEVPWAGFRAQLIQRGLDRISPSEPTDEVALRRAVEHEKPTRHPKVSAGRGIWTVHLRWRTAADKIEHDQKFSVKIGADGAPVVKFNGSDEAYHRLAERLSASFCHFKEVLTPGDVGSWFRWAVVKVCDGVPLGGDWWFVPKAKQVVFDQIQAVIQVWAGYEVVWNDVTDTDNAVRMVLLGFKELAAQEMQDIRKFLEEHTEESNTSPLKVSERHVNARKVRVEAIDGLRAKMDRYSKLVREPFLEIENEMAKLKNELAGSFFTLKAVGDGRAQGKTDDAAVNRFRNLELDEPAGDKAAWTTEEWDARDNRFKNLEINDRQGSDEPISDDDKVREVDIDD